jgi:hypothetical protein
MRPVRWVAGELGWVGEVGEATVGGRCEGKEGSVR